MTADERDAKRRKLLRKGTTSCWECKQRKVKCEFDNDLICSQCRRRGTHCTSQEFPQAASLPSDRVQTMDERIARVEARMNELANNSSATPSLSSISYGGDGGIPTPISGASIQGTPSTFFQDSRQIVSKARAPSRTAYQATTAYVALSKALHDSLPSSRDLGLICEAGSHISVYTTQHLRMSEADMERESFDDLRQEILCKPSSDTHPVLIGKYIFSLATFLQYLHPGCSEKINGLSEPPRQMMKRLTDIAGSLVTANDQLLGTVEGLECLVMEGTFLANTGNIRRAWLVFQRAVGIAQLMGLHRTKAYQSLNFIDPTNTKLDRQIMWFRILYVDRFLSLMLGLPPNSSDNQFASKTALSGDTPFGRLQRHHAVIALQIAQLRETDLDEDRYQRTQDIDANLQEAANALPDHWWLTPNFTTIIDADVFTETLKVVHQMYHFNLINQLHLPYMLQSHEVADAEVRHRMEYSKLTCVNASRDILNRFVAFRSFNRVAFCCRSVDFFALMAAMTLLLAHLDSHSSGKRRSHASSHLAHQRLNDRAMVEQTLHNMEHISSMNDDALSQSSARFLNKLLAIESDAASGKAFRRALETDAEFMEEEQFARIWIPYFGLITIAARNTSQHSHTRTMVTARPVDHHSTPNTTSKQSSPDFTFPPQQTFAPEQLDSSQQPQKSLPSECPFPVLTAGSDDWNFQGVDLAFFDTIMGRDGMAGMSASENWSDWQNGVSDIS